jgi:ATP-dependent DNA helicase RecG
VLELGMAMRRVHLRHEPGIAFQITPRIDEHFRALFPFKFTKAQERVMAEIAADMRDPAPMNRLLQGDVGSGKTAVALYPLLVAVANKYQAAIMAPTEILAEQHYLRFSEFLRHGRVRMALLKGGASAAERRDILDRAARGELDLVIGTHALIEEDVDFARLGAVVVDEQHKFGVLQRHKLRRKGVNPDVLVMTATPIPRTLALTVFGDLDVSMLDEMPPGRHPILTQWVAPKDVAATFDFLTRRLREGEQGYVVYPLVEESDKLELGAATKMAERLQRGPLRQFRVGLLHGRMSSDEKEHVMRAFRGHEMDVLVATQVVEVGVDVANATVMIVEDADRFGLAQLHQLRGRIGRGSGHSWCFLVAKGASQESRDRLSVLVKTCDGFKIAEEDLRMRGPGEFLGTRQHGLPELHFGDPINDFSVLQAARRDAFQLVAGDPQLAKPGHAPLRQALEERFKGRMDLIHVG